MVHLLEQSIASVEQIVSSEFGLTRAQSGWLGAAFRLPYGLGAVLAGLLADRLGGHRVLSLYLGGASVVCLSMLITSSATIIYIQLFVLGCFASMYHPAGLALLANSTTVSERTRALGVHGVFGSTGIAAAPFLAGITLSVPSVTWKGYYGLLGLMSAILAVLVATRLRSSKPLSQGNERTAETSVPNSAAGDGTSASAIMAVPAILRLQRIPFAALVLSSATSGIVYGGFLHFLKRYLSEVPQLMSLSSGSLAGRDIAASYFSAVVLICGALSQFLTGRLAKPRYLPQLLTVAYASNAPFLIWMAYAEGLERLVATCLLAFAHFTNQPLYNSLLPEYIPPGNRSTWFGFSNMLGFGLGAVGPPLVGAFTDYRQAYLTLAAISLVAAAFPAVIWFGGSGTRQHAN